MSLLEMSENYNISRNAIHKALKDGKDKLYYYESILKLYEKSIKIKKIISNLDSDTKKRINDLIWFSDCWQSDMFKMNISLFVWKKLKNLKVLYGVML